MATTENFVVMDGMLPIEKQQALVRKYVEGQMDLPSFRWRAQR